MALLVVLRTRNDIIGDKLMILPCISGDTYMYIVFTFLCLLLFDLVGT